MSSIWGAIRSVISAAGSIIKTVISTVSSGFSAMGSIFSSVGSQVTGIINNVKNVISGLANIDISGAGAAIMNGFLGGLQSAWEGVKNFVGGIADWIKEHKGPISYDRKLLVPAGKAIMGGFNETLKDKFKDVQATVKGMAAGISSSFIDDEIDAFSNKTLQMDVSKTISDGNYTAKRVIADGALAQKKNEPMYITIEGTVLLDGKRLELS